MKMSVTGIFSSKYNILSTNSCSICYWCRPTKKSLFLVPAAFLSLLCFTALSLECNYPQDQSYLCPIFFRKPHSTIKTSLALHNTEAGLPKDEDLEPLVAPALQDNRSSNVITELQEDENLQISELLQKIDAANLKQTMWNLEKFGPITSDTIIILVQAHRRLEYLQVFIECLKNAKYIEETLLVFSHGYYSEEINNVVQSIQFARVLQIFFPHGLQTHPNTFPGLSPNDCPHGASKEEIEKLKCFGRPRDVKSLQVKHHWWWKINTVFNGLKTTQNFNGLVFFLEEDHYVFPDFLYILRLMRQLAPEKCPECNLFGMGLNPRYTTIDDYRGKAHEVHVVQWNNMGFAFDRQFWAGLNRCADMFCEYNDYNWDFTLAYLSHKCLPRELKPLNVVSSRVFHIGDCGVHFHGQNCSALESLKVVKNLQEQVSEFLFPPGLSIISTFYNQMKVDGHNGGWDDPRDIQLCKNITRHLQP